jgi:hypothetical protein
MSIEPTLQAEFWGSFLCWANRQSPFHKQEGQDIQFPNGFYGQCPDGRPFAVFRQRLAVPPGSAIADFLWAFFMWTLNEAIPCGRIPRFPLNAEFIFFPASTGL